MTERYRPKTFDEMIGQDLIVESLKEQAKKENPPHMIFYGPAGVGKTTAAHCFAKAANLPIIEINASDERGIDTIRNTIKNHAKASYKKIIYLGEADNLTHDAAPALRRIMELYSKNTIFILSANYVHDIIDPIQSRCAKYVFNRISPIDILRQLVKICKAERISYNTDEAKLALKQIVSVSEGDMRRAINILETVVTSEGRITETGVQMQQKPLYAKTSLEFALNGNFDAARTKIEELYAQTGFSVDDICKELYKALSQLESSDRRLRLFSALAELEYRCKRGCDVPLQLVSFMAYTTATGAMNA